MNSSPRTILQNNANRILDKVSGQISIYDLYLLLRVLGLTTPNIYNLDIAIQNLSKVCSLRSNYFVSDINAATEQIQAFDKRVAFLATFSSGGYSHKSTHFLTTNKRFNQNRIYGLFAGLHPDICNLLSLKIDQDNPTYHPILAIGLQSLVVINKTYSIGEKYTGIESLCSNLKLLATNQSWKDNLSALLKTQINHSEETKKPYSLDLFLNDIKTQPKILNLLPKSQKDLLNKLVEIKTYADSILLQTHNDFESFPENMVSDSAPQRSNGVEIYSKAEIADQEEDEELEQKSNLFLGTVGQRRKERDAQNILFTNQTLLLHEIALVEGSIHDSLHCEETLELQKVQLCRALMLYYAIPIERIPQILIGIPELDHSREDMSDRILIDLENDMIFLPTPIQALHRETTEQFKHLHLPLPLEQTIKTRLSQILATTTFDKLFKNFIDQETLKSAKSFKNIPGFRQYRITAGKVASTLSHHLLSASHDEVKVAYLQGGAYNFVHMGCYYTSLKIQSLVDLYIQTCRRIFTHHCLPVTDPVSGRIGSLRTPEIDEVHRFLSSKSQRLEKLKKEINSSEKLWDFHNELTLYTITLLNLSAVHRPNNDPYYSVLNFIEDDFVQITEKVIMKGFEGRLAVLHRFSCEQYKAYLKHLGNLVGSLSGESQNPMKQMLHSLIQGEQNPKKGIPLFFLVTEGKLKSISKRILSDYYHSHPEIELSENFYRHLLSSELATLNTPRIFIATQMGHISKGLEPFSKTSLLSPNSFKEQFVPYLDQYFDRIKPTKVLPPHIAEYRSINIESFNWKPSLLGPFKREQARAVRLDTKLIQKIDQSLKDHGVDPYQHKVYFKKTVQTSHLNWIKLLGFRQPQKTLFEYYLHKQSTQGWKIEHSTSLSKSLFDKTYGINYQLGKRYFEQVYDYTMSYLNDEITLTSKQQRMIIALSAMTSGAITHKAHLLDISNRNLNEYIDIGISHAIDLNDSNKNQRTWILNSLSIAVLNKSLFASVSISERDFDHFLNQTFKISTLSKLINRIRSYLLLTTPSFIVHYVDSTSLQSSIGGYSYQAMMGNYSHKNDISKNLLFNPDSTCVNLDSHQSTYSVQGSKIEKRLYQLATLLSQHKIKGVGHTSSLREIIQWETQAIQEQEFNFSETLLVSWVKKELDQKRLKVGSISTYFSKTYKFIDQFFSPFSTVDELDIEILKNDIYPEIIQETLEAKSNPDAEPPGSALASFHNFIAETFGLEHLHFSGRQIQTIPSIQPIILEPEHQACLNAIDKNSDYDEKTKTCLKIGWILYKRFGLRLMEVFKLQPKNVCRTSKTIHISGNHQRAEKTEYGNRLLPYNILLAEDEVKLLEQWTIQVQSNPDQKYLLFGQSIAKLSYETVTSRVTRFFTLLLRSVTNNPRLSIKSLRKSFASEVFLNLILSENHLPILKTTQIHRINAGVAIKSSFNATQPHNLNWLLASWMGHSTPLTTFEYYSLTLDLVAFAFCEKTLENTPNYLSILKSLSGDKFPPSATYKNLNRFKGNKFVKFHLSQLSENLGVPFKHHASHYGELFTLSLDTETLQKVLAYFSQEMDEDKIDKKLFLTKKTAKIIINSAKELLKQNSSDSIPAQLFKKAVETLSWWRLDQQFNEIRVPQLTKKMLENAVSLKPDEVDQLFNLWTRQLNMKFFERGELVFSELSELEEFLALYKKFNAHDNHKGYLLIEINGIKNSEAVPVISHLEEYLVFQDNRVQKLDDFAHSQYILKLSYRDKEAKKMGTCQIGLNSIIFFAKLHHVLTVE